MAAKDGKQDKAVTLNPVIRSVAGASFPDAYTAPCESTSALYSALVSRRGQHSKMVHGLPGHQVSCKSHTVLHRVNAHLRGQQALQKAAEGRHVGSGIMLDAVPEEARLSAQEIVVLAIDWLPDL